MVHNPTCLKPQWGKLEVFIIHLFAQFVIFFVVEAVVLFNSRTTVAGAIIVGLLLVFYDSKRSIGFLKVLFTGSTIRSDDVLT